MLAWIALPALAAMTPDQLDRLQASANSGNADAAFRLGRAYKLGDDVPANLDMAEHWFERALRLGNARAGAELGLVLLQNGKGAAAMPYLKQAAEKGDARAQYGLGTLLYGGQGVAVDAGQGRAWMQRAAKAGLPAATEALAIMDKALGSPARPAQSYRIVSIAPQTQPSVPKPVAKAKAAPIPTATIPAALAWYAQLGAFAVSGNAQRYWNGVKPRLAPQLRPYFPINGSVTRLIVGPFAGREAATHFCAAERKRGGQCFEVKTAG